MSDVAPILPKLEALPKAKGPDSRGWWSARCPAHQDARASFGWHVNEQGVVGLDCQAGCPHDAIVAAVGCAMADLFPPKEPKPTPRSPRREVAVYPYRDADGTVLFEVVRFEPKDFRQRRPVDGAYRWDLEGVTRVLYNLPELLAQPEKAVVVVEGEKDVERLAVLGILATTNVGGAGKWRSEYVEPLRGRTVYVIPDNDKPGRDHAVTIASSLAGVAKDVRIVELPGLPAKGDVSDWLDAGHTPDELREMFRAAPHHGPKASTPEGPRAAVERCVQAFREWLYLPDPGALHVTRATVAANRAEGDPVWLMVVGPPGSGKTEIVGSIVAQPDVHAASTITEGSLLSGTSKRERAASAKGGLLREIGDFGIVVLKDFGSILSMNRDTRAQVLAALREVFDGSWVRHVGTDGGQTLSWSGKVGLIAGVTPAIDAHHAVIGSMGERFIFYRLPLTEANVQAGRALGHVGREKQMRQALAGAVREVLEGADPDLLLLSPDVGLTRQLVAISTLAARCRSAVDRDSYSREITLIPEPEAPARLALVLLRLHNALRAIGVDAAEAWELVKR